MYALCTPLTWHMENLLAEFQIIFSLKANSNGIENSGKCER